MNQPGFNLIIFLMTAAFACQESGASLMAHYTFDDSAGITNDVSGSGKNLKVYGAADYSSEGVFGGAAVVNGTTQGLQTPSGILPDGSFTLALWIRPDTWAATSYVTKSFSGTSGFQCYGAWPTELAFATMASTGKAYQHHIAAPTAGDWMHVAFTFATASGPDGTGDYTGTVKSYVDGVLVLMSADTERATMTA